MSGSNNPFWRAWVESMIQDIFTAAIRLNAATLKIEYAKLSDDELKTLEATVDTCRRALESLFEVLRRKMSQTPPEDSRLGGGGEVKHLEVKCPYCGSQRVYGNDEVRVCCIFDHGSKTVLEVEPDEYRTLEPCFTCKDCGRDFIVVYELKEVRRLKEEILGVEGDP